MATGLCGTCGGSVPGCGCYVTAGTGVTVTGDGSSGSPFVIQNLNPGAQPAYATVTDGTDIVGSGAAVVAATTSAVSLVNGTTATRYALVIVSVGAYFSSTSATAKQAAIYPYLAHTTDGTDPSSFAAMNGWSGEGIKTGDPTSYMNHVAAAYLAVAAGATLKIKGQCRFYGEDNTVTAYETNVHPVMAVWS